MSDARLAALLDDDKAHLSCALVDGSIVGYCVAVRGVELEGKGAIDWVSQLVVDQTYRETGIATKLLYSVWQFSDSFAWGLATANPYAVRGLETATRRKCRAGLISRYGSSVLGAVREHVSYLPPMLVADEGGRVRPRVDTKFYVDHSEVPRMQQRAARADRPWALGDLAEGEEWLAMTFREQAPHALDDEHLADLLTGSDGIWIQAYEGMTLDDSSHAWHRHQSAEIKEILRIAQITDGGKAIDVGCGDGRHATALIELGFDVLAVDISPRLVERAQKKSGDSRIRFQVADARRGLPAEEADLAICLYDVIGSSAVKDDDERILRSMFGAVRPGGVIAVSVMNEAVTWSRIPSERKPQSNAEFLRALEALPPSDTMETTGAVFDPDYLLVYRGVHYRKEQFRTAQYALPAELVVRDRRYSPDRIHHIVESAGFEILTVRPVRSGSWDQHPPLDLANERAKELLVVARRPTA